MTVSAAIGGDIILHAYHSVGMMMVGNDGYHQHYQADEKKNKGYVLLHFQSLIHAGVGEYEVPQEMVTLSRFHD